MKRILTLLGIFFLCSVWSYAQNCTIGTTIGSTCTLTIDGTLTIPASVNLMIEVKAWGAGGGSESAKNKRSGGGGGAYLTALYSVSGGSTFPITVGQGAVASAGGDTSFDFDGSGDVIVGGGGLGGVNPGAGGTGPGAIPGGAGGDREKGGLDAGGGGGGSGPGNLPGGNGGTPTDGEGGTGGAGGSVGGAGGAGGNDMTIGSPSGVDGSFPGGGAGGKGTTMGVQAGAAGGDGQVIICVTSVLPVELHSFNADINHNHIALEWQTASELNNQGFEVERSVDGSTWDLLGFIEGSGTSSWFHSYAYNDKSPMQGLNYYRLKQIDLNGDFNYSKVIPVLFQRSSDMVSYPNPVQGQLIIEGNVTGDVKVKIYNTLGQVVYQNTQFMDEQIEVDVSAFPAGNYYLEIRDSQSGIRLLHQDILKVNRN